MTSDDWRWSPEVIRGKIAAIVNECDGAEQVRLNILYMVQDAQTDSYFKGRRSVQRVIIDALDIRNILRVK